MNATDRYDAIVVGSGAGGAAAAWRLAGAGLRVAVLEKGGALPTDGSTLDVARVVHRGEFLGREAWTDGRGRALEPEEHFNVGGKTKWYGAALLRFAAGEFAGEPAFDLAPWPIGPADLAPWYAEAERLLGVRRFEVEPGLARIAARVDGRGGWQAAPLPLALSPDIHADPHEARHFDGFASARGLKGDAENAFLARAASSGALTLLTGAEVVGLEPAAGGPLRVAGVRLADGRRLEARAVLLGAGALHSPRLLERYLRAGGLGALPVARRVGRNLKLHLLTAMVSVSTAAQHDVLRKTLVFTNPRFPHSSVQPLGFDAGLIAGLVPRPVPRPLAGAIGARAYGFFLQTEDGSSLANRVLDGHGGRPPVLDYDAARTPASEREHRAFARAFALALGRAGFASFTQRIGTAGTAHACGTLAAGTSAADSVVDAEGRVHGLEGLYVVDGSALPRSSRVNPSLTIYAWGLRVADRLAARLAGGAVAAGRPAGAAREPA